MTMNFRGFRMPFAQGCRALLALALACAATCAPAGGTAAMNAQRFEHTATLLHDGTVLAVGGSFAPATGRTAEVYLPASNTWKRVAGTATAYIGHTATLLRNGKVLAIGNGDGAAATAANLFDPGTGTWSPTSAPAVPRTQHNATRLRDGRVLVSGGFVGSAATSACEIYDPATATWRAAAPMTGARNRHTASLLADGRVLVVGGFAGFDRLASTEIYDPVADRWTALPSLAVPRVMHAATVLGDGRVVVTGGVPLTGETAAVEIFRPGTNDWVLGPPMIHPRSAHSAALRADGKLVVAAGVDRGTGLSSVEVFDPVANAWTETIPLATPRSGHSATLLGNGSMLLAGDVDFSGNASFATSETIEPDLAMTVKVVGGPDVVDHASVLLPSGEVLTTGGRSPTRMLAVAQRFDPGTEAWTPAAAMPGPRAEHAAVLLADGRVLVAGGTDGSQWLERAAIYDPVANTWSDAGKMLSARLHPSATLLPNGIVLVTGGAPGSTAELYNPGTNAWYFGGQTYPRYDASATLLADGRVLVAGGVYNASTAPTNAVTIYDPMTNAWSDAAPMEWPRSGHAAALLPDGRVMVTGGSPADWAIAEIYDPRADRWTRVGDMATYRRNHVMTTLPTGDVIVAGGAFGGQAVERYDVAAGGWRVVAMLRDARLFPTATLLNDGRLLVTGGNAYGPETPESELVDSLHVRAPQRPVVASTPAGAAPPAALELSGSGFAGRSGGGGAIGVSATNFPVMQLQRIGNDAITYLPPGNGDWDDAHFRTAALPDLPLGWYRLNAVVDGVASAATMVQVTRTADAGANEVQFAVGGYAALETGVLNVLVMRTGDCSLPAGVNVRTIDGTAQLTRDFLPYSGGAVGWAAGDCFPKTYTLVMYGHSSADGHKSFELELADPRRTSIGARKRITVTILDNESLPTRMPGTATIVANPFGPVTVQNATLAGSTISGMQRDTIIQLGAIEGDGVAFAQIDLASFHVGAGNRLTIRSGARKQVVVLNNVGATAAVVEGALLAEPLLGVNEPPLLHLHSAAGIRVEDSGYVTSFGGLVLDALGADWHSGADVVNEGTVEGGPALDVMGGGIHGAGFFRGNATALRTFGTANNPVNGARYLANGLMLTASGFPPYTSRVALRLNGYGTAPQVFNVMVDGDVAVDMPSVDPSHMAPANNHPVLADESGAYWPGEAPYGGGSMIVQSSRDMTLAGTLGEFVFPGGIVFKAGRRLDINARIVDNGWTGSGKAFQGLYFEAPQIVSGAGPMAFVTNNANWVNFSTLPQAVVTGQQVVRVGGGAPAYVDASDVSPHLNAYSLLIEAAASGRCWTCLVNYAPVRLH